MSKYSSACTEDGYPEDTKANSKDQRSLQTTCLMLKCGPTWTHRHAWPCDTRPWATICYVPSQIKASIQITKPTKNSAYQYSIKKLRGTWKKMLRNTFEHNKQQNKFRIKPSSFHQISGYLWAHYMWVWPATGEPWLLLRQHRGRRQKYLQNFIPLWVRIR